MAATRSARRSARLAISTETREGHATILKEEEETVRIKEESDEATNCIKDKSHSPENSLNLLALVANSHLMRKTKTSKFGVTGNQKVKDGQIFKKLAGSKQVMSLHEILDMPEKQLVHMFSELTSNELTRNFAYTCYLMPETCAEIFTSFGNENKAKSDMLYHLLDHLKNLKRQETDDPDFLFTAQTVQSRRKHGLDIVTASKHQTYYINHAKGKDKSGNRKTKSKDGLAGKKSTGLLGITDDDHSQNISSVASTTTGLRLHEPKDDNRTRDHHVMLSGANGVRRGRRASKGDGFSRLMARRHDVKPDILSLPLKVEPVDAFETNIASDLNDDLSRSPVLGNCHSARDRAGLETFKSQPYVDHSYISFCLQKEKKDDSKESIVDLGTSRTSGWKYGLNEDMDEDDKQILSVVIRVQTGMMPTPNRLYIPIVRVPKSLAFGIQPSLAADTDTGSLMEEHSLTTGTGFPGSDSHMISDCDSDEDDENDDFETMDEAAQQKKYEIIDPSSEMEKNLAVKYINDLRCKKKEDTSLICKICKTKAFTATATLLYHYRSHAGIKPFLCLICNTTFTRQHSLNYHMLIHNNQNRFTCKDCGRMFRHPSHFKEHLRRHTGETPFMCTDCTQRFKTRNTYKRHLRTRHGKLLLASGIRVLSREEFLRVRTKPYLHVQQSDDVDIDKVSIEDEGDELLDIHETDHQHSVKLVPEIISRKPAILSHSSSTRNAGCATTSISFSK